MLPKRHKSRNLFNYVVPNNELQVNLEAYAENHQMNKVNTS